LFLFKAIFYDIDTINRKKTEQKKKTTTKAHKNEFLCSNIRAPMASQIETFDLFVLLDNSCWTIMREDKFILNSISQ